MVDAVLFGKHSEEINFRAPAQEELLNAFVEVMRSVLGQYQYGLETKLPGRIEFTLERDNLSFRLAARCYAGLQMVPGNTDEKFKTAMEND